MKSDTINNLQLVLIKCITACESCLTASLSEKDVNHLTCCIQYTRDCADICVLATRYIARDSVFAKAILKKCIKISKACEDECRKHSHGHCKKCADICHETHKAIEKYVAGKKDKNDKPAKKDKTKNAANAKEEIDLMV